MKIIDSLDFPPWVKHLSDILRISTLPMGFTPLLLPTKMGNYTPKCKKVAEETVDKLKLA